MVCVHSMFLITGICKVNDLKNTDNKTYRAEHTPAGTFYAVHNYHLINPNLRNQQSIPIVFVHGVGLNHAVWQPQVESFKKSHCVISYDLMGHGNSSLPPEKVTLKDYADQLDELLTHLQIPAVHIVGHSMGALISVAYTLYFPFRVVSTIPLNIVYKRTTSQRKAVLQRASEVLENNKITGIETALDRWFDDSVDPEYQKKVEVIKNWLEQVDPVGYGRTYRLFAQSDKEFEGRLQEIRTPVLFITGDKDLNSTPTMSKQMASETIDGEFIVINNEAHMLAYISPELVNPMIKDFLTKAEQVKKADQIKQPLGK